jgi:hypothetical protein
MTAVSTELTGYEPLDPAIREQYARDGFVVIKNALAEQDRAYFEDAVDRIYSEEEAAGRLRPDRSVHVMGWMHRDPRFVELLSWPTTFPYIWGNMGWNIYTHHNHIDVNPPKDEPPFWNWHQDGYRQNSDLDMDIRPMFMTKICYALTATSTTPWPVAPRRRATRSSSPRARSRSCSSPVTRSSSTAASGTAGR